MRIARCFVLGVAVLSPLTASAQCFNRDACGDKALLQIRSQISITVPVPDSGSASDKMKIMEDARHDLYTMSNRECDMLKTVFGGDCTLSSINLNSSMQDRGNLGRSAFVSVNSTYDIKRDTK